MTDYEFKYELASAPTSTNDGSGMIIHDIWAVCREQGSEDDFIRMGLHKNIPVPADDMKAVMDMPHGNANQKQAKVVAYKDALVSNLNTTAVPIVGWSKVELEARMDANDESTLQTSKTDDFITNTLGQEYPVQFSV